MDEIFKQQSQTIWLSISQETIDDPDENTKTLTLTNRLPIKALIEDLLPDQLQWRMPGIKTTEGKMVICQSRWKPSLLITQTITIDDTDFYGWKDNGKMSIKKLDSNYIMFYVYNF